MNQNHKILARFFPLTNLFMIIITFFLLAKRALCAIDPYFLAWNRRTCGDGQNITFPFYIEGEQEPFCGYPGFHLSCDRNGKPILKLPNNDFVIHQIFYKNQSILVSNAAVFDTNANCTPPIRNISLPDERFSFLPNQRGLFLLYNCNRTLTLTDSRLSRYNVDCLSDGGEAGPTTTLAILDNDPLLGYASNRCQNGVVAPVDLYRGADDGFQGLLRGGFLLNWIASDCSICQGSGGRCGFENATYHFKCYCPDRPHTKRCHNDTGEFLGAVFVS